MVIIEGLKEISIIFFLIICCESLRKVSGYLALWLRLEVYGQSDYIEMTVLYIIWFVSSLLLFQLNFQLLCGVVLSKSE